MGLSKRFVTSAVAVTSTALVLFALAAVPAYAQHRGGGGARSGGSMRGVGGASVRGAMPRAGGRSFGAPRTVMAPRATFAPRVGPARGFGAPRVNSVNSVRSFGPRTVVTGVRPAFAPHGVVSSRSVVTSRGAVVATRGVVAGPRGVVVAHGFAPHAIGPRIVVAPHHFARPFYAFRPRYSVG